MDLPDSNQVPRDWFYSGTHQESIRFCIRDCHPLRSRFPSSSAGKSFCNSVLMAPRPRRAEAPRFRLDSFSLAATGEVEFSFLSCGYLDVSVHRVGLVHLWIGCTIIRESRDQRLFDGFPGLFAAFHALHRLLTPRHPPHALSSLTTMILVSLPTRPRQPQTFCFAAIGRLENKLLLPRPPIL
jgi:hypothetical protein